MSSCEACCQNEGVILVEVTHYVCEECAPRFKRSNVKKSKWEKKKSYQTPKWIVEFQKRFQER